MQGKMSVNCMANFNSIYFASIYSFKKVLQFLILFNFFAGHMGSICPLVCNKIQSPCLPPCPIACCNKRFETTSIESVKRSNTKSALAPPTKSQKRSNKKLTKAASIPFLKSQKHRKAIPVPSNDPMKRSHIEAKQVSSTKTENHSKIKTTLTPFTESVKVPNRQVPSTESAKRSNIEVTPVEDRSKVIRQSCSCLMDCDGPVLDEDNQKCHEKCTCHPDENSPTLEQDKISDHVDSKKKQKAFSRPHIGSKEMEKIKHLFSKWIREYNGGVQRGEKNEKHTSKSRPLRDQRVSFISKMLKNYQYFRQKEKTLRLIEQEQEDLSNQQQHLEDILTKQEDVLTTKGSIHEKAATPGLGKTKQHHLHKDYVNISITTSNATQAPPTTTAPANEAINQQTLSEIENIKKQLEEIQQQQVALSQQQAQLADQLKEEQAIYEQAKAIIQLVLQQTLGAAATAATANAATKVPKTQSDYENEISPEAPEASNEESVQPLTYLGQLQRLLSKLMFKNDENSQEGNANDDEQYVFFQNSQEGQTNRRNENSVYAKDADIPVEIDRSDLNDQGLQNSLLGRDSADRSVSEDDNEGSFLLEKGVDEDGIAPGYAVMEKKTLHPNDLITDSQKTTKEIKDKPSDLTHNTENRAQGNEGGI